jgi:prepilin-type N-terminal cleavage/methylation domain-containing protein
MKKGFSLIELLIVIAIISLFGFLVFDFLKKAEVRQDPYTIKNLQKILQNHGNIELICTDKCSQCFTHTPGSDTLQETSSDLKEIQAYTVDKNDNPQKIEFGRLKDHRICLRYRHYANGSSTQIILESEEKFFYFPSYFGKISVHASAEDAAEAWIKDTKILNNRGNYY